MMQLGFAESAWKEYLDWQAEDKKTLKRINELIKSIMRDGPMEGPGKPEVLKYERYGTYSRRINEKDRLIYEVTDDRLIIKSCKGHYK